MDSTRQKTALREMEPLPTEEFHLLQEEDGQAPSTDWMGRLRLLWSERKVLLRVTIWAFVLSIVTAFLIPKSYESSVSILPPDPLKDNGAMMAAMSGSTGISPGMMAMASSLLGMKSSADQIVGLLHSRTVQEHIVERFNLQQEYGARYKQEARKILDHRTDIAQDRKSGVISIAVSDHNPERSRDLAQAYVDELNKLLANVSMSSARRERIFVEQRLVSVKTDLEDAEKQFSVFASKNATLDIAEQSKAMVESAAVLQGQLIAAQSELQGLQQIFTSSNVRVRSAQARIAELKRQLDKVGGTNSSLNLEDADATELYPSIRRLPLLGVQWADLFRRMKVQEKVFELLTQQYEIARIQEAKEVATISIVDAANLPEKKAWPPRLLIIVFLTILILVAAAAIIVYSKELQDLPEDDPRHQAFAGIIREMRHLGAAVANRRFFRRHDSGPPFDGRAE